MARRGSRGGNPASGHPVSILVLLCATFSLCQAYSSCAYTTWTVPHGTYYDGHSQRCYCNDGRWEKCVPLQEAYAQSGNYPSSNNKQYLPLPSQEYKDERPYQSPGNDGRGPSYSPAAEDYTRQNLPVYYDPAPAYKTCYNGRSQVSHGEWYVDKEGWQCYCDDGKPKQCSYPSDVDKCQYNGYIAPVGGWIDTDGQRCQCSHYGKLEKCYDLCDAGKTEVMFLFDISTSIAEDDDGHSEEEVARENWEAMKLFTVDVVMDVPLRKNRVRVGYTSFADYPSTRISFNNPESSNKNDLLASLATWFPEIDGQTYLARAMRHVRDLYTDRDNVAKVLVILTDGNADDEIEHISEDMRRDGFHIWAVGVGNGIEYDELLVLTGTPKRVLMVDNYSSLSGHLEFLREAVCYRY
mmetsp:Transcript_10527/g.29964  ORF Transcript_10527/g.29964 Transcript_10527/m.29964 type:complete len:409 (-) Transcript_10527:324-1550(-)|eukprot:CAMPEP_0117669580 /NCGR_PEP_ID=MMETSP0804-20121206/12216_1 /TAXON_ID=1074897 /ORGANISM="Tetraselmis astigmatica, Strain CCMP880" /LENGTH=408 /DNA_ID=CAMNT_0005477663 /DNA_START=124 /DNA_END=1350 /DNA_ORIENTATION=-